MEYDERDIWEYQKMRLSREQAVAFLAGELTVTLPESHFGYKEEHQC